MKFNNGFINDNYILTAIEADCFGESVTFFICAKRMNEFDSKIEIILRLEDKEFGLVKYEVCEGYYREVSFDIESVTNFAEEYLKDNALEMYVRLKRRLYEEKSSVSVSYLSVRDYYEGATSSEKGICISIPRKILGDEVCEFIQTSDERAEITFDKEDDAVKIFHSVFDKDNGIRCGSFTEEIKFGETNVRSFINLDDLEEIPNEDIGDEQDLYDKNSDENAKEILAMFNVYENKSEETTGASEEDAVLV